MTEPRRESQTTDAPEFRRTRMSATVAPHRKARGTGHNGIPRVPPAATPASGTSPNIASTGARGHTATPAAETAAPAPAAPTTGLLSSAAAATGTPMAAAALGALASIAAQYGDGSPTADIGKPYSPPVLDSGIPTGPVIWDGDMGARYSAIQHTMGNRSDAMGTLNSELSQILDDVAGTTVRGRAAVQSIVAEVATALTAIGPVENSPAGQQLVMTTLGSALQRAGSVLGQGQTAAALSAERIAALAENYVRASHPTPPPPRRRMAPSGRGYRFGPPRRMPEGQQGQWIDEALRVLRAHGYDTGRISPADIATIIQHESGGNPHAINNWDSNAAAGTPSKGLMQTIDPTFDAYSLPGHRDIWNPVDNIVAGVRYAIDRYGSVGRVPGVAQLREGGSYVGY